MTTCTQFGTLKLDVKGKHRGNFLLSGTEVLSVTSSSTSPSSSSAGSGGGLSGGRGENGGMGDGAGGEVGATAENGDGRRSSTSSQDQGQQQQLPYNTSFQQQNNLDNADFSPHKCYAIVTSIGIATMRGNLLRGMFYPNQSPFRFQVLVKRLFMWCFLLAPICSLGMNFTFQNPFSGDAVRAQMFAPLVCAGFTELSFWVNPMLVPMFLSASAKSCQRLEKQGVPCRGGQDSMTTLVNTHYIHRVHTHSKNGIQSIVYFMYKV